MINQHIHKYVRDKLGKEYIIYKCTLPNCSHYLPENLIIGKSSICWGCGIEFTITKDKNGVRKKPKCSSCKGSKVDKLLYNLVGEKT